MHTLVAIESVALSPFAELVPWQGKGEAYAISLAHQKGLVLVSEDKKARNLANRLGIPAVRMAFFVLEALQHQRIATVAGKQILLAMHQANMFDQRVYREYLLKVGTISSTIEAQQR